MKKILIVDDDDELRTLVSEFLRIAAYHTSEAPSGEDAIEKITSDSFDVALLDVVLPKANGIDVLAEFRRLSPRTKVIMITAFPSSTTAVDAMKRGASDFISKPFNLGELHWKIRAIIEEAKFEKYMNRPDLDLVFSSLSNPIRRKILNLLSSKLRVRLSELSRELEIEDLTKVAFHLRLLKESGVIEPNREKFYTLTPEGKKVVECLKTIENYLIK